MKPRDVYKIVDSLAPFALSKEYCAMTGGYDNSGLLLDCNEEVTGVLFSLDLSKRAIQEARRVGANCIVTHHPAIYAPLKGLTSDMGGGILLCARAGISVVSAHLNLDCASDGIDENLMKGLGGKTPVAVYEQLSGGAYGRVYDVEKCPLEQFVTKVKKTFSTDRAVCYGEGEVRRVASFCGAGFEDRSLAFAVQNGADTVVSSDGKHHLIAEAVERGLNVVLLTHYAAECYGFVHFAKNIEKLLKGVPCTVFTDGRLL